MNDRVDGGPGTIMFNRKAERSGGLRAEAHSIRIRRDRLMTCVNAADAEPVVSNNLPGAELSLPIAPPDQM